MTQERWYRLAVARLSALKSPHEFADLLVRYTCSTEGSHSALVEQVEQWLTEWRDDALAASQDTKPEVGTTDAHPASSLIKALRPHENHELTFTYDDGEDGGYTLICVDDDTDFDFGEFFGGVGALRIEGDRAEGDCTCAFDYFGPPHVTGCALASQDTTPDSQQKAGRTRCLTCHGRGSFPSEDGRDPYAVHCLSCDGEGWVVQDTKPALTHTGTEAQGPDSAAQVAVLREALLDIERWSKPMNPLARTKPEYRVWRRANEALNTLQEADTASLVQDYNAEVVKPWREVLAPFLLQHETSARDGGYRRCECPICDDARALLGAAQPDGGEWVDTIEGVPVDGSGNRVEP